MTNHPLFIIGTNRQLNIVNIALITDSEETLDFAGSVKNVKTILIHYINSISTGLFWLV